MERNRDWGRTTMPAVNGIPRRRQRITPLRDSTDQDSQMELQETVRLGGDEREFPKRRRIHRSAVQQRSDGGENYRENSTDSSDGVYYEEEENMRIHRANLLSPPSSSLTINRRGLRTLLLSPVLRAAADEMFGVPVPRRGRSSSAKRLHEYCNSGSGDDLNRRRSSHSPVSLIGSGGDSIKKMRSAERRTTPISNPPKRYVIQDDIDIEIEVAEALFDLMKQSQSQSLSSQRQVDRDGVIPASDELKMSKVDGCQDDNNAFSVQNEPSIKVNAETVLADSMKEQKKEGTVEKEKFSDDSTQDLVSGDEFVNKVKVGFPKESESPSCVKVIACDIQDPTVKKAHYDAIIINAKKETKLEIDLMASPLPSSPEREGLVDMETDPGVMTQAARKDCRLAVASEMQGRNTGVTNSHQQSNVDVEKHSHDTTHQQGLKEHNNQSPTSLLPFPYGMSGWPGVVPHPGFMPPLHAVLPINGSAKSSKIMQPPQFNFSQSRSKRCATHQYLARSVHCHQQLIKKSLSFGSTSPAPMSRAKSPNQKYTPPGQNFIPGNPLLVDFQGRQNLTTTSVGSGKEKSYAAAVDFKTSSKPLLQASNTASASSCLHCPGFVFPFDHHQTTMTAPANSSGPPQSASLPSNSGGKLPVNFNLALPNASTATSLNIPMFPSNEAAASYMAMLQNNGCSIPISTNIAIPSFKGGPPSMAFFNASINPSPAPNVTQNKQQLTTSHASGQSASQNTNLLSHKQSQCLQQIGAKISENKFPRLNSQPEKPSQLSRMSDTEINWKNGASLTSSQSVICSNSQSCSLSSQAMKFAMIPSVSVGGNKQIDGSDRVEAFGLSFGSNASVLNFSSSGMFHQMCGNGNQMIQHKPSEGGGECSKSGLSLPKFDGLRRNINFLSQPFQSQQQQQAHNIPAELSFFTTGVLPISVEAKWENFRRSAAPPQVKGQQSQINFPASFEG